MRKNCSKSKKEPGFGFSVVVILVLSLFVALGVGPLNLNVSLILFLSWLVLAPFGAYLGYSFGELEGFAYEMAKAALAPAAIIMSVGIMIATWLAAGTVPVVLVGGLSIITPSLLLLITFILCSLVSMLMGTSWGTIGTAGIAMLGVGTGLGLNPAMVAGAIVSGAYFGDKMSPMSDSTNICSTITGTPLMTHIKYMFLSSGPAFLISSVLYFVLGFIHGNNSYDPSQVNSIINELCTLYKINLIPIIPIVIVLIMLFMKKSTVLSLLMGALSAAVIAVLYQGIPLSALGTYMLSGFKTSSDDAIIQSLLNRGGMSGMMNLVATFIGALGLGGMLNQTGIINPLLELMTKKVKSGKSLIISTMIITWIAVTVIATNNFAFAMIGTLFKPIFERFNLKSENLSRALEDCGTLGNVLVPWSVGAGFATGTLGISAFDYAPWAFQNYITPLVTMVFVLANYKIAKIDPSKGLGPQD